MNAKKIEKIEITGSNKNENIFQYRKPVKKSFRKIPRRSMKFIIIAVENPNDKSSIWMYQIP